MPVQLERSIQRACVRWAREHGCLIMKVETIVNVGWPDIIVVPPVDKLSLRGVPPIFVEFKRDREELTPIQESVHRKLAERGQRIHVCRSFEEFKRLMKMYDV